RMVAHTYCSRSTASKNTPLDVGAQSRLFAIREQRPDLHARGARGERRLDAARGNDTPREDDRKRRLEAARRTDTAGEPEGKPELSHLREVDDVALTVDRFATVVQAQLAARRGGVAACRRALDDEPIDTAATL